MQNNLIIVSDIDKAEIPEHVFDAISPKKEECVIYDKSPLIRGLLYRLLSQKKTSRNFFLIDNLHHVSIDLLIFKGVMLLSKAKENYLVDLQGNVFAYTKVKFIFIELLLYAFFTITFPLLLVFIVIREICSKPQKATFKPSYNKILYLRTDITLQTKAGGSIAHISGILKGFLVNNLTPLFVTAEEIKLPESLIEQKILKYEYYFNYIIDIFESKHIIFTVFFNYYLKKEIKNSKFDLIYQRYNIFNFSGVMQKKRLGIPFILEYNGSELWIAKNWGGKPFKLYRTAELIEEANFRHADLIVVVSDVLQDELLGRGVEKEKILVVPNGVNTQIYDPDRYSEEVENLKARLNIPKGKTIVGFIGTFGAWHGAEVLARAVKRVAAHNQNVHFLIIGDGAKMAEVKTVLKTDGVEELVTLTGMIPQWDAPTYLSACDIFVSPHVPNADGTPFFGSPTKLFEYMSMGKGIVASNLEQIGEVLKNSLMIKEINELDAPISPELYKDKLSVLIKPGSIEELAKGILFLAENQKVRDGLGENARKEALEKYTWDSNVKRIIDKLLFLNNTKI